MPGDEALIGAGVISGAVSAALYFFSYKARLSRASSVQEAKVVSLDQLPAVVQSSPTSPYVAIEGTVQAPNPISTQYSGQPIQGVLRAHTAQTKYAKMILGKDWWDYSRQTSSRTDHVPFNVTSANAQQQVLITDITPALEVPHHLNRLLQTVSGFQDTTQTSNAFMEQLSRGSVTRGVNHEERVLPVGSRITVLGHVTRQPDGTLVFSDMSGSGASAVEPFIVSTESFAQGLDRERARAGNMWYGIVAAGVVAGTLLSYAAVRYGLRTYAKFVEVKRLMHYRKERRKAKERKKKAEKKHKAREAKRALALMLAQQGISGNALGANEEIKERTNATSSVSSAASSSSSSSSSSSASSAACPIPAIDKQGDFSERKSPYLESKQPPSANNLQLLMPAFELLNGDSDSESDSDGDLDLDDVKGDKPDVMMSLCVVCQDQQANVALMECGHMYTCMTCANQLQKCPVCRRTIKRRQRIFAG